MGFEGNGKILGSCLLAIFGSAFRTAFSASNVLEGFDEEVQRFHHSAFCVWHARR